MFLIYIFLLLIELLLCEKPMIDILDQKHPAMKRIVFLTKKKCFDNNFSTDDKLHEFTKDKAPVFGSDYCGETIGFLPITKEKFKIFVTATATKEAKEAIKLSYKKDGIEKELFVCKDNKPTGTVDGQTIFDWQVKYTDEIPYIKEEVIQCSILLEGKKIIDISGEWFLEILNENETSKEKLVGTGIDISKKESCDPSMLDVSRQGLKDDKNMEYMTMTLEDDAYYTPRALEEKCEQGFIMTFTIKGKTPEKEEIGKSVECEVNESDPKKNKYVITVPVLSDEEPKIEVKSGETVALRCTKNKCNACSQHLPPGNNCPSDAGCEDIKFDARNENYEKSYSEYSKCLVMRTDQCKMLQLNNEFIRFDSLPTYCGIDGKYKINDKVVSSIRCAKQYSPTLYNVSESIVPTILKKKVESFVPTNCHLPYPGCWCNHSLIEKKHGKLAFEGNSRPLRISNKNGSDWLRIDSILFDVIENKWTYNRTYGKVTHLHVLENDRAVRCIAITAALASGVKKNELPNPNKNIVVIVNIILLTTSVAIAVPGGILFVNSRVKKRELLKAAKKEKKDQSGEKKTGEGKKDEEKKNEA